MRFAARRPNTSSRSRSSNFTTATTGRPFRYGPAHGVRDRQARRARGIADSPDATTLGAPRREGPSIDGVHVHSVRLRGLVAHEEVLFGNAWRAAERAPRLVRPRSVHARRAARRPLSREPAGPDRRTGTTARPGLAPVRDNQRSIALIVASRFQAILPVDAGSTASIGPDQVAGTVTVDEVLSLREISSERRILQRSVRCSSAPQSRLQERPECRRGSVERSEWADHRVVEWSAHEPRTFACPGVARSSGLESRPVRRATSLPESESSIRDVVLPLDEVRVASSFRHLSSLPLAFTHSAASYRAGRLATSVQARGPRRRKTARVQRSPDPWTLPAYVLGHGRA